eukprot:1097767-Rhodomonas_salina.1
MQATSSGHAARRSAPPSSGARSMPFPYTLYQQSAAMPLIPHRQIKAIAPRSLYFLYQPCAGMPLIPHRSRGTVRR